MALECKLISYDEETCRLVGEIVNVCADNLQPVDIIIMNRQLYIIVVMIIEIILFVGIFIAAQFNPFLIYIIVCAMLVVGIVFMILDATENERSKKKIREIYNIKTEG